MLNPSRAGAGLVLAQDSHTVQLAGAVTNKTNAFPEPGRAVYLVLSGTFDRLPAFE